MEKALAISDAAWTDRLRKMKQPQKGLLYTAIFIAAFIVVRWLLVLAFPESLYPFLTEPFEKIWEDWPEFFLEVVISGLLTGILYSMVALGFVLIFKASGMFNFAQGIMVLFAALMLVGLTEIDLKVAGLSGVGIVWLILAIVGAVCLAAYFAKARSANAVGTPATLSGWTRTMKVLGYALVFGAGALALVFLLAGGGPSTTWTIVYLVGVAIVAAVYLLRAWGKISLGPGLQSIAEAGRVSMYLAMFIGVVLLLVAAWTNKVPAYIALPLTMIVMIAFARVVEALILRHLVNQEQIILFMATIGLAFFVEGFGELLWGGDVRKLDVGIPEGRWNLSGIQIQQFEVVSAIIGALLVAFLAFFFQKTKIGRALRAVADDHQAALSVGISLRTIWIFVWATAGIVALVAGIVWGGKSGVQFSLSLIALKALPVLILGGLTSIPGAIVGGLIIGLGEKVVEVYWGPAVGGATENWFAYVLALVILLFRPQGLFGEKIIERV